MFLKQDEVSKMWFEFDDDKARCKLSQTLREKEKDEKLRKWTIVFAFFLTHHLLVVACPCILLLSLLIVACRCR